MLRYVSTSKSAVRAKYAAFSPFFAASQALSRADAEALLRH